MNAVTATRAFARRNSNGLLVLVCLAQYMVILDVSIVNVALPAIHDDLGFSTAGLQWIVNAYTLTFAGFLMLGARRTCSGAAASSWVAPHCSCWRPWPAPLPAPRRSS
jgi:MFS family permease